MAGPGGLDESSVGPAMTEPSTTGAAPSVAITAGLRQYASEVGRRLRDLDRQERQSIEADLVQHLQDTGCSTYEQCHSRFGPAATYGDGVRAGLDLPPFRRSRRPVVVAVVVVAAVAGAAVIWRSAGPEPLPDDWVAISSTGSFVSGSSTDGFGTGIQLVVGAADGDARLGLVLTNTSDRTLDVESIGPPYVLFRANGTSFFGGSDDIAHLEGDITLAEIWDPDVRIDPLTEPDEVSIGDHARTGRPFAPFRWEPGASFVVSIAGPVAACDPTWTRLDGVGASVVATYSVGDRSVVQGVAQIGLDTGGCRGDEGSATGAAG